MTGLTGNTVVWIPVPNSSGCEQELSPEKTSSEGEVRFKSTETDDPFTPTDGPFPPTVGPFPPTSGSFPPTDDPFPPTGGLFPPTDGPFPPTGGPFPPTGGPFPPADRPVRKTILPFPCAILYNKASVQSRAGGRTGRTGRPQGSGDARYGEKLMPDYIPQADAAFDVADQLRNRLLGEHRRARARHARRGECDDCRARNIDRRCRRVRELGQ